MYISKKVHTNKKGSSENIRTQYCDNILYEHKLFMLACCGQVVRVLCTRYRLYHGKMTPILMDSDGIFHI